jgi:hypothetical protein
MPLNNLIFNPMIIKSSLCAALFAFAVQGCVAQTARPEVFTSSGGFTSNASVSLSWTLGESLIETGSSSTSFLTQGFQQPTNLVITSLDNPNGSTGNISAYPNPVTSSVNITSVINQPLRVDVMDLTGRKLFTRDLSGNDDNQVSLSDYSAGIYLFRVYNTEGQLLQTLKIDKIK